MGKPLSAAAQRVEDFLSGCGKPGRVLEMPDSTRTAADAAAAIGCTVAQIAKSLVFRERGSGAAVLIAASGANRVDEKKVSALLGGKIERADADFVRAATGYAIGGVPPVAHPRPIRTLIDRGGRRSGFGRGGRRSSRRFFGGFASGQTSDSQSQDEDANRGIHCFFLGSIGDSEQDAGFYFSCFQRCLKGPQAGSRTSPSGSASRCRTDPSTDAA